MAKSLAGAGDVEDFKVSQRALSVLKEIGVPGAEKYLSIRLAGVYKLRAKNVRVQSLFDVVVVAHEGTHAISHTYDGIDDPPKLRMEEGCATLVENYLYDPATISKDYPHLVKEFLTPGGKYYQPATSRLLDQMNSLVEDYAKMKPWQRIG